VIMLRRRTSAQHDEPTARLGPEELRDPGPRDGISHEQSRQSYRETGVTRIQGDDDGIFPGPVRVLRIPSHGRRASDRGLGSSIVTDREAERGRIEVEGPVCVTLPKSAAPSSLRRFSVNAMVPVTGRAVTREPWRDVRGC
jgi:hypothetical protein